MPFVGQSSTLLMAKPVDLFAHLPLTLPTNFPPFSETSVFTSIGAPPTCQARGEVANGPGTRGTEFERQTSRRRGCTYRGALELAQHEVLVSDELLRVVIEGAVNIAVEVSD
mmetsp:Transcript_87743/g.249639  ORF Transcript_87743/g.249639 Transcript_87743/m.249639 type:complete len:112 (-) Transcript_87743:53-388(-)